MGLKSNVTQPFNLWANERTVLKVAPTHRKVNTHYALRAVAAYLAAECGTPQSYLEFFGNEGKKSTRKQFSDLQFNSKWHSMYMNSIN